MTTFGKRLRYARERKSITQTDAANQIGSTSQKLSHYERDYVQPDIETIKRLSILYNISADYLLGICDIVKSPATGDDDGLSKDEREIIRLFQSATPETKAAMLHLLRAAEVPVSSPDASSEVK